ncbi:LacI family DNA-binding transcriptional regulator [Leucobacter sp. HY1910]
MTSRDDAPPASAAPHARPTMRDVAERVGLSRQLVSIVLRGAPGASEASRERILAAARELGYHPDDSARMLRRRRSGQIGVLFTMRQPFEVDLVEALYRRAAERGFALALSTMSASRSQETALAELMRQRIEALIVLDAHEGNEEFIGLPAGIPTLLLGGPASPEPHDSVDVENRSGIALAVEHLAALGHERIAYVGPEAGPNAAERLTGYRDAMRSLGFSSRIVPSAFTEEGGHLAATALLAELRPALPVRSVAGPTERSAAAHAGRAISSSQSAPTALICVNDHCAIGALQTLVRAGVRVPEDVSIIGFDDSSAAALPFVQLTSVRPDPDRMAQLAIETVHARLEHPDTAATTLRVTPTLTLRASTAPPAAPAAPAATRV